MVSSNAVCWVEESRSLTCRVVFILSNNVTKIHSSQSFWLKPWKAFPLLGLKSRSFHGLKPRFLQFVAVNPAYTSQDCSQCGHRQKLTLAQRVFVCPCCGLTRDRDHN